MGGIIISGVHGVGKGTFITQLEKCNMEILVLSASKLISNYHNPEDSGYKKVKDVAANQKLLVDEIKKQTDNLMIDYVLDGHISLINAHNQIETIPEGFFVNADIKTIVLIQDEPLMIEKRLKQRDGRSLSVEVIKRIQEIELEYSESLSKKYEMDLYVIKDKKTKAEFFKNMHK